MTLRQAVTTALKQNPDIALARLDEEKAKQAVRLAKDPFIPRITAGSGLAYSNGFPMSIEGSAPSVFQASATQFIYNRQQSYLVAQSREEARGAGFGAAAKRDEVAWRAAGLFLDAERAARISGLARREAESLEKVLGAISSQVEEGRVLAIEAKRARLTLAQARQMAANLESDQTAAETALAMVLGFGADDRVRPAGEERAAPALPESEQQAVEEAIAANKQLRQFESQIAARNLEVRGQRAARWPRVDLVAQYALFARFNNYEDFFRKFQRNNGQIGVSFQVPILPGPGISAQVAQTQSDIARFRIEMNNLRNRLTADTRQAFRNVSRAQTAAEVARLDLEVARDQLSIYLARLQEGRTPLTEVEQARVAETNKWIAFYEAQNALERARLALLAQTGELAAALQ